MVHINSKLQSFNSIAIDTYCDVISLHSKTYNTHYKKGIKVDVSKNKLGVRSKQDELNVLSAS